MDFSQSFKRSYNNEAPGQWTPSGKRNMHFYSDSEPDRYLLDLAQQVRQNNRELSQRDYKLYIERRDNYLYLKQLVKRYQRKLELYIGLKELSEKRNLSGADEIIARRVKRAKQIIDDHITYLEETLNTIKRLIRSDYQDFETSNIASTVSNRNPNPFSDVKNYALYMQLKHNLA